MLVDKLLRTCPDIENLYLLVRPKKGKDIHTRLEEIFDDQVFSTLREQVPKFRHKIVAISGDCAVAGLGLKIIDRQTLMSNVHIVFHAAATVRFDEKLKLAVNINVQGTRELLELCSHMQKLQVRMVDPYFFFVGKIFLLAYFPQHFMAIYNNVYSSCSCFVK